MSTQDSYARRGVSSGKEDVHKAIQNLDKGLVPGAFCKILPDLIAQDPEYAFLMHADGAGTKSSLAYIYWKETGDLSVWEGIAQDAVVMNTDDLMCAGVNQDMVLSSTIGRNKHLIPGEVIKALIEGTEKCLQMLRDFGIRIHSGGGETADVGDLVRTVIVDSTLTARIRRNEIIDNHNIRPGQVILGFASDGQASYENQYNSGIGSNGLTGARHDIFSAVYREKYPESFDPSVPAELVYCGKYLLTDRIPELGMDMGRLVLSPTRTYLPVMQEIFREYKSVISGLIHCSGGGQTKCLHFLNNIRVIKNNLPLLPFIFSEIQNASGMSSRDMYKTYNMGVRLELYTDEKYAADIIRIAESFHIHAAIIGYTEACEGRSLSITAPTGEILKY